MLVERRREVADEVKDMMRSNRDENTQRRGDKVRDFAEDSEVSAREDVELALIQMKSDTLTRVDQALGRLDQGTYGNCFECGDEISEKRLRALPFAPRCKDCQETHEAEEQRSKQRGFGLFADVGPRFDS
ncbi:MAG: TraR/DksA family transcriptional regulator [Candidatus Yanofskybacteria bacterium]|nr:TraR/DksA family transcriptional regulator [Candidatus Yanofskybacteria bacterium]